MAKVLIGQNTSLFWTRKGAQKFGAHDGEKVSIDFLLGHKNLGEEYLHHGYFRDEPLSKMIEEEGGADVGKVLVGQNSSLVWTREGIKFQFPKKSKARRFVSKLLNPIGKQEKAESTPREGDRVSMDFFA